MKVKVERRGEMSGRFRRVPSVMSLMFESVTVTVPSGAYMRY